MGSEHNFVCALFRSGDAIFLNCDLTPIFDSRRSDSERFATAAFIALIGIVEAKTFVQAFADEI
jgi:hypothetical protein